MSARSEVSDLVVLFIKQLIRDAVDEVSGANSWINQQKARNFIKKEIFLTVCGSVNLDGRCLRGWVEDKINVK